MPRIEIISPKSKPIVVAQTQPEPKSDPTSPRSTRFPSWIRPARSHKSQHSVVSVATTVDEKVIERDRARDMDEMAQLYAVVMQHDEEKTRRSESILSQQNLPSPTLIPPEFRHLAHAPPQAGSNASFTTTVLDDDQRTAVDSRASTRRTKVSPLSFASQGQERTESVQSTRSRPGPLSIRGQAISSPINFSHPRSPTAYPEEIPLSPRLYTPGPPPPTPPQKDPTATTEEIVRGVSTPLVTSLSPPPTPGRRSAAAQAREAERDRFHRARAPAALSLRSQATSNSSQSLPFRQAYPEALQSAPPIQTTFLERNPHLLNGARTSVPQTPYSPYQPQTPITPITPRLATKQELRRAMKRQHEGPLTPEDMVPSDKQMWGDPL